MRRGWWIVLWVCALAGCATMDERVQSYSEDGVHLFQQGNYAGARETFQAALKLKSDDAALLYNLGECNDRLGDSATAEKYYRDCLQRSPDQAACRHSLVVLLVRNNRRPE